MIRISIVTNEIGAEGELTEHLAAVCEVRGQQIAMIDGDMQFVPIGMPVFSERYGRLIDFDIDGEEWARNLWRAFRNGAVIAVAEENPESTSTSSEREVAYADAVAAG
jgi:hypothetical protein